LGFILIETHSIKKVKGVIENP